MLNVLEFPEEEIYGESFSRTQLKRLRRNKNVKRSPIVQNHLELKSIIPRSKNQEIAFNSYNDGQNLLLHGVAGTGKTFVAIYLALRSILDERNKLRKIVIVRSAVPGRDIGFLPGNPKEKMAVYEAPYQGIFAELFGRDDAYSILKTRKSVEFIPTSFIRGITIDNAIVIVEEFQNMDAGELNTIITRLGKNTRLVLCGDHRQDDLSGKKGQESGLKGIVKVLSSMKSVEKVEFGIEDIQRSAFVKEYLIQRIRLGLDVALDI